VGADVAVPDGAKVIDASGLEVYPGMFDPVTQIGLEEVGAVRATVDTTETGEFNPDVTAATVFNADSAHVDVTRASGITEVLAVPGALGGFGGGNSVIGGNASAVNLGGWNINDLSTRQRSSTRRKSTPCLIFSIRPGIIRRPCTAAPRTSHGTSTSRRSFLLLMAESRCS
jgi:hypothetical protein